MHARRTARLWGPPLSLFLLGFHSALLALRLETPPLAVGSFLVGVVGAVLAHQRQALEEARHFKALFTEFNARYDALNERLAALRESGRPLSDADRRVLADYFNLCAEEHLFASKGWIDERAWRSWCAGMLWYFDHPPIRAEWERESATRSYYGPTLEAIRHAGLQG